MMSEKLFTHASPTLFNAATPRPQLSSCFLLTMSGDSIEDIYDTLKRCALISKSAGGIGLNVHCIRATGSYIAGTNGTSNGLVPMLRVYNNTARYVDQVMIWCNQDLCSNFLCIAYWLKVIFCVYLKVCSKGIQGCLVKCKLWIGSENRKEMECQWLMILFKW